VVSKEWVAQTLVFQTRNCSGLRYRSGSRDLHDRGVNSESLSENQPQGLLPKSAVQFTTRVSGAFGLAFGMDVTNLPSRATS
jgi:hypothetical protein